MQRITAERHLSIPLAIGIWQVLFFVDLCLSVYAVETRGFLEWAWGYRMAGWAGMITADLVLAAFVLWPAHWFCLWSADLLELPEVGDLPILGILLFLIVVQIAVIIHNLLLVF